MFGLSRARELLGPSFGAVWERQGIVQEFDRLLSSRLFGRRIGDDNCGKSATGATRAP